jgi:hypothetical protein
MLDSPCCGSNTATLKELGREEVATPSARSLGSPSVRLKEVSGGPG